MDSGPRILVRGFWTASSCHDPWPVSSSAGVGEAQLKAAMTLDDLDPPQQPSDSGKPESQQAKPAEQDEAQPMQQDGTDVTALPTASQHAAGAAATQAVQHGSADAHHEGGSAERVESSAQTGPQAEVEHGASTGAAGPPAEHPAATGAGTDAHKTEGLALSEAKPADEKADGTQGAAQDPASSDKAQQADKAGAGKEDADEEEEDKFQPNYLVSTLTPPWWLVTRKTAQAAASSACTMVLDFCCDTMTRDVYFIAYAGMGRSAFCRQYMTVAWSQGEQSDYLMCNSFQHLYCKSAAHLICACFILAEQSYGCWHLVM